MKLTAPSPRGSTHAWALASFAAITKSVTAVTYEKPQRRLMTSAVDQDLALVFSFNFIASSIAVKYSKSSAVDFRANLYSFWAAANSAFEGLARIGRITGFEGTDCNCRVIPARSAKSTST